MGGTERLIATALGGNSPGLDPELESARAKRAAISDVLRLMSSPGSDLQAVLQRVVEHTAKLIGAGGALLFLLDGDLLRYRAGWVAQWVEQDPDRWREFEQYQRDHPVDPMTGTGITPRAYRAGSAVTIPDTALDPDYPKDQLRFLVTPHVSLLGVPLLRGDEVIGAFSITRLAPWTYPAEDIALVQTFADQAVIALENVRLFSQTKEALDRQTAVAEVTKAINAVSDLPRLLDQVIRHATRLADAENGFVYQVDGDVLRMTAAYGNKAEPMREWQGAHPIRTDYTGSATGRAFAERRTVHIPDVEADVSYTYGEAKAIGNFRSLLAVPMLKDGVPLGVLAMWRTESSPFTDTQIQLVELFADQAVIAIENASARQTVERQRAELRRFLSPQVADLITSADGQALLSGHRREITVVFCDLRGFTAFSETAEPEEALAVVRTFHETLGPLIFEQGGTLEHFEGDGAMVFFNDPVAVEDHVLRAVRMTIAMRERMAEHAASWRKRGHALGFGCGIATGYATLGRIGFDGRYDYGAIGPVTNLSARLGSEAKAGQILMSQRAFAQVEDRVEVEAVGELSVKGYSRPQAAYNVVRLRESAPA